MTFERALTVPRLVVRIEVVAWGDLRSERDAH